MRDPCKGGPFYLSQFGLSSAGEDGGAMDCRDNCGLELSGQIEITSWLRASALRFERDQEVSDVVRVG